MKNCAHELKSGSLLRSTICGTHTLSWVAPHAVVQGAMRHSSPETKRRYQLGMVKHLRQNPEKANEGVQSGGLLSRRHTC
jgi:hypothetical protein